MKNKLVTVSRDERRKKELATFLETNVTVYFLFQSATIRVATGQTATKEVTPTLPIGNSNSD